MASPKFVGPYCLKLRKLVKIWRAIARRHAEALDWVITCHNARERALFADINDNETDP